MLGDVGCGVLRAPLTRSACSLELPFHLLCSVLCFAAGIIGTRAFGCTSPMLSRAAEKCWTHTGIYCDSRCCMPDLTGGCCTADKPNTRRGTEIVPCEVSNSFTPTLKRRTVNPHISKKRTRSLEVLREDTRCRPQTTVPCLWLPLLASAFFCC